MNSRRFKAKANRKNLDELQKQLINHNIEYYTALKWLTENSSPNPEKDQNYLNSVIKKNEITENTLQRKLEHSQNQQNSSSPIA